MSQGLSIRSKQETRNIINAYGERLTEVFGPLEIRLFGSYLKGTATEQSDLDLAVVSNEFRGMEPYTAYKILNRMKLRIDRIIDPIPALPKELADPDLGTIYYAIASGNELAFKS